MPLHHRENQYRGVNAHLHSYFQRRDGWPSFHTTHITDLMRALEAVLPLESGYLVSVEQSLQLVRVDPDDKVWERRALRPDDEPERVMSIVIYRQQNGDDLKLVTRLEVLSPANKPPGSPAAAYQTRRLETLRAGVNLVELDLLHERPFPADEVPAYARGDANAYPYMILVSQFKPTSGHTQIYGMHVDDPFPVIALPLADEDVVGFDWGPVYQQTFRGSHQYALRYVDYEQDPEGLDTYSADDQARIRQVMARAAQNA